MGSTPGTPGYAAPPEELARARRALSSRLNNNKTKGTLVHERGYWKEFKQLLRWLRQGLVAEWSRAWSTFVSRLLAWVRVTGGTSLFFIRYSRRNPLAYNIVTLTLWHLRKRCNPPIRRSCGKKSSIIQAQTRPCEGKNNLQRHLWMSCGIISIREDAEGRNAVPSSLPLPVCLCFCSESLVRFDVSRLIQPPVA